MPRTCLEEIQNFLFEQTKIDPTFEGVVIRDHNGLRFKIKSPTYLGLHRLKGEGDNLFNPKYLLPFVLSGEKDELLTYYPEVREAFELLNKEVENEFKKLEKLWLETKNIKDQKEFALAIKGQSYFIGLLFEMKRDQKTDLRKVWNESSESILKFLKQQKKLLANFQFSA